MFKTDSMDPQVLPRSEETLEGPNSNNLCTTSCYCRMLDMYQGLEHRLTCYRHIPDISAPYGPISTKLDCFRYLRVEIADLNGNCYLHTTSLDLPSLLFLAVLKKTT